MWEIIMLIASNFKTLIISFALYRIKAYSIYWQQYIFFNLGIMHHLANWIQPNPSPILIQPNYFCKQGLPYFYPVRTIISKIGKMKTVQYMSTTKTTSNRNEWLHTDSTRFWGNIQFKCQPFFN